MPINLTPFWQSILNTPKQEEGIKLTPELEPLFKGTQPLSTQDRILTNPTVSKMIDFLSGGMSLPEAEANKQAQIENILSIPKKMMLQPEIPETGKVPSVIDKLGDFLSVVSMPFTPAYQGVMGGAQKLVDTGSPEEALKGAIKGAVEPQSVLLWTSPGRIPLTGFEKEGGAERLIPRAVLNATEMVGLGHLLMGGGAKDILEQHKLAQQKNVLAEIEKDLPGIKEMLKQQKPDIPSHVLDSLTPEMVVQGAQSNPSIGDYVARVSQRVSPFSKIGLSTEDISVPSPEDMNNFIMQKAKELSGQDLSLENSQKVLKTTNITPEQLIAQYMPKIVPPTPQQQEIDFQEKAANDLLEKAVQVTDLKKEDILGEVEKIKARDKLASIDSAAVAEAISNLEKQKPPKTIKVGMPEPKPEELEYKPIGGISYTAARQAHAGTSFTPDKRADSEVEGFKDELLDIYNQLKPLAKTDAQKKLLIEEMQKFEGSYAGKYNDYLRSQSGVVSSMIVGPSKFPVERMRKKNEAIRKKLDNMGEWKDRAINSIKRSLKELKIEEAGGEVEYQKTKIANAREWQEVMKKVNTVIRKKIPDSEKIKGIQAVHPKLTEDVAKKLLEKDYAGRVGFPDYELTNNLARIKNMEATFSSMERKEATPTSELAFEGGKIIDNAEADRVQIKHDVKPSEEVRNALKARGFRWSPEYGTWQRKRTPQALYDAKKIVGYKTLPKDAPVEFPNEKEIRAKIKPTQEAKVVEAVKEEPIQATIETANEIPKVEEGDIKELPNGDIDITKLLDKMREVDAVGVKWKRVEKVNQRDAIIAEAWGFKDLGTDKENGWLNLPQFKNISIIEIPVGKKNNASVEVGQAPNGKWAYGYHATIKEGGYSGVANGMSVWQQIQFAKKEDAIEAGKAVLNEWLGRERGGRIRTPEINKAPGQKAQPKKFGRFVKKGKVVTLDVGKEGAKLPDELFPEKALEEGTKHELEHTDNVEVAKNIAKDHLKEDKGYYEKLDEMEKKPKEPLEAPPKTPPAKPPEKPPVETSGIDWEEGGFENKEFNPNAPKEEQQSFIDTPEMQERAELELEMMSYSKGVHPLEEFMRGRKVKAFTKGKEAEELSGMPLRFKNNKTGIFADELAQEAYEAGLIPDTSTSTFIEALKELGEKQQKFTLSKPVQDYLKAKVNIEKLEKALEDVISPKKLRQIIYSNVGLKPKLTPFHTSKERMLKYILAAEQRGSRRGEVAGRQEMRLKVWQRRIQKHADWLAKQRFTPEQKKELYQLAYSKGLIIEKSDHKHTDKLAPILSHYKDASFSELKNYIAQLQGSQENPKPMILKLYGDINKDAETMKLINAMRKDWIDINKIETGTLDPIRQVEKVSGLDAWDDRNVLAQNLFDVIAGADAARFDRFNVELKELHKAMKGILPDTKASADLMRKFEEGVELTKDEQEKVDFLHNKYDMLIEESNNMRRAIGKPEIPYRKDYMTHIREYNLLTSFFKGDVQRMNDITNAQLDAIRHGDFTKGDMPFNQFAQKRLGEKTKYDAVGNYEKYLETMLYETYLAPAIHHARKFAEYSLLKFPNMYESTTNLLNQLAGKPSTYDRSKLSKAIFGNLAIKWVRSQIAKNALIGNINFNLVNLANITTSAGELWGYTLKGLQAFLGNAELRALCFKHSSVLQSRKSQFDADVKAISVFDEKSLDKLTPVERGKVASKQLQYYVEGLTRIIEYNNVGSTWCGAYLKAIDVFKFPQEKAFKYADTIARRTQTGYRSYEIPAIMRSDVGKLLLQFQTWTFNAMNHLIYDMKLGNIPKQIIGKFSKDNKPSDVRYRDFFVLLGVLMLTNEIYRRQGWREPTSLTSATPRLSFPAGRILQAGQTLGRGVLAEVGIGTKPKDESIKKAGITIATTAMPFGGTQAQRLLGGKILPDNSRQQKHDLVADYIKAFKTENKNLSAQADNEANKMGLVIKDVRKQAISKIVGEVADYYEKAIRIKEDDLSKARKLRDEGNKAAKDNEIIKDRAWSLAKKRISDEKKDKEAIDKQKLEYVEKKIPNVFDKADEMIKMLSGANK